jgi:putative FmdB family regulatory protein
VLSDHYFEANLVSAPSLKDFGKKGERTMPTYEYQCETCNNQFLLVLSIAEHEKGKAACPNCQSEQVKQLFSTFIAKTSRKS